MADTPEKKVKKKVATELASLGAYYFFPATGGFGSSGVPDIVGCLNGRFFGIECKAGQGKPTRLQLSHLNEIKMRGGVSIVVNEDNVAGLRALLEKECLKI